MRKDSPIADWMKRQKSAVSRQANSMVDDSELPGLLMDGKDESQFIADLREATSSSSFGVYHRDEDGGEFGLTGLIRMGNNLALRVNYKSKTFTVNGHLVADFRKLYAPQFASLVEEERREIIRRLQERGYTRTQKSINN